MLTFVYLLHSLLVRVCLSSPSCVLTPPRSLLPCNSNTSLSANAAAPAVSLHRRATKEIRPFTEQRLKDKHINATWECYDKVSHFIPWFRETPPNFFSSVLLKFGIKTLGGKKTNLCLKWGVQTAEVRCFREGGEPSTTGSSWQESEAEPARNAVMAFNEEDLFIIGIRFVFYLAATSRIL